jgi:hypothetical protein
VIVARIQRFPAVRPKPSTHSTRSLARKVHDLEDETNAPWVRLAKPLAKGEFSTLRLRSLNVAVRIRETATRIRLAFATNCPDAALFRSLVNTLNLRPD